MRVNKMFLLVIFIIIVMTSCNGHSVKTDKFALSEPKDTTKSKYVRDSINQREAIDAQLSLGDRPDSLQETPSPMEERKQIARNYDKIKTIDTTVLCEGDSLRLHLTYYCLKNRTINVPKAYNFAKKDFVTHPYSSNILLLRAKDTILNRQFNASDFNAFFSDKFGGNLKRCGSILMPTIIRKSKYASKIVLDYAISIPATDIGIGMLLVISKNGAYKIVEAD